MEKEGENDPAHREGMKLNVVLVTVVVALAVLIVLYYLSQNFITLQNSGSPTLYQGTVAVKLTDPPQVPAGTTSLILRYSSVAVHTAGGGWATITLPGVVNILALMNVTQTIGAINVTRGATLDQVRFNVSKASITVNSTTYNVTVPSGSVSAKFSQSQVNGSAAVILSMSPTVVSIYANSSTTFVLTPAVKAVVIGAASQTTAPTTITQQNKTVTASTTVPATPSINPSTLRIGYKEPLNSTIAAKLNGAAPNITIVASSLAALAGNKTGFAITVRNNGNAAVNLKHVGFRGNESVAVNNTAVALAQSASINKTVNLLQQTYSQWTYCKNYWAKQPPTAQSGGGYYQCNTCSTYNSSKSCPSSCQYISSCGTNQAYCSSTPPSSSTTTKSSTSSTSTTGSSTSTATTSGTTTIYTYSCNTCSSYVSGGVCPSSCQYVSSCGTNQAICTSTPSNTQSSTSTSTTSTGTYTGSTTGSSTGTTTGGTTSGTTTIASGPYYQCNLCSPTNSSKSCPTACSYSYSCGSGGTYCAKQAYNSISNSSTTVITSSGTTTIGGYSTYPTTTVTYNGYNTGTTTQYTTTAYPTSGSGSYNGSSYTYNCTFSGSTYRCMYTINGNVYLKNGTTPTSTYSNNPGTYASNSVYSYNASGVKYLYNQSRQYGGQYPYAGNYPNYNSLYVNSSYFNTVCPNGKCAPTTTVPPTTSICGGSAAGFASLTLSFASAGNNVTAQLNAIKQLNASLYNQLSSVVSRFSYNTSVLSGSTNSSLNYVQVAQQLNFKVGQQVQSEASTFQNQQRRFNLVIFKIGAGGTISPETSASDFNNELNYTLLPGQSQTFSYVGQINLANSRLVVFPTTGQKYLVGAQTQSQLVTQNTTSG